MRTALGLVLAAVLLVRAGRAGRARGVAALQVALRATGDYAARSTASRGPMTAAAIRRFQSRRGLVADGIAGPSDAPRARPPRAPADRPPRAAPGRARLGRRRRCSSCSAGTGSRRARWTAGSARAPTARCAASRPGPASAPTASPGRRRSRALRSPPPARPLIFAPPLAIAPTDRFGPRGDRFHTGIDYPAGAGTPRRRGRPRLRLLRGLGRGRLRQPRDRRPPARDDVLLRAPLLDRRAARAVRGGRQRASAASARRATRPGRTCTSSCGCAAPPSRPASAEPHRRRRAKRQTVTKSPPDREVGQVHDSPAPPPNEELLTGGDPASFEAFYSRACRCAAAASSRGGPGTPGSPPTSTAETFAAALAGHRRYRPRVGRRRCPGCSASR